MKSIRLGLLFLLLAASCQTGAEKDREKPSATAEKPATGNKVKSIVFFGDSITAAYGLDPAEGYTAHIQRRIDSLGLAYIVVNAGVSGETSAGGLGRIDWILKQPVDIFVLELGANDGLRGISPEETEKNLQSIIERVRKAYPESVIILAGMQVPPSMGQRFSQQFAGVYPRLADKNKVVLIPFILDGVGGEPSLNQADGIHPNAEGAKIVAATVWKSLNPIIGVTKPSGR